MERMRSKRKTRPAAPLLAGLTALVLAWQVAAEPAARAPAWSLETAAGGTVDFPADLAGRPAVLVFWTTWCPYCRALMPDLEALRARYEPRDVAFFALNIWEDADPVAYMAEHAYAMTLVLAADLVAEEYAVTGTPAVFVVDGAGRIRYTRPRGATPAQVAAAVARNSTLACAGGRADCRFPVNRR